MELCKMYLYHLELKKEVRHILLPKDTHHVGWNNRAQIADTNQLSASDAQENNQG